MRRRGRDVRTELIQLTCSHIIQPSHLQFIITALILYLMCSLSILDLRGQSEGMCVFVHTTHKRVCVCVCVCVCGYVKFCEGSDPTSRVVSAMLLMKSPSFVLP